jgi:hypothetical protein
MGLKPEKVDDGIKNAAKSRVLLFGGFGFQATAENIVSFKIGFQSSRVFEQTAGNCWC